MLLTIGLVEKNTSIRQERAKSAYFREMTLRLTDEIEERKKAEKELRESEKRFRLLFELSPQPISLTELKTGLIIDVNHQIEVMTGYSKTEMIGKTSLELQIISVSDRQKIMDLITESPQIIGLDIDLHSVKGNAIRCLIYTQLVNIQESEVLVSVFSDITERKKNEVALKKSEQQLKEARFVLQFRNN